MGNYAVFADFFCWHKKFLVYNLIMRNLKIRYRKSLLGMMWTVLIPAGSAAIFYVVLKNIMRVHQENHFVFILSCQIAWVFFASSVSTGLEAIVNNFGLLNKVPLPPQSLVLAENLTLLLNLALSLPILFVAMAILGPAPSFAFLQYFILLGVLALTTYSIALLLGLTYVYLRDLKHLMSLILQFWFYLTPVLYTEDMIPDHYRWMLKLNPVGKIFAGFQAAMRGAFLTGEDWVWVLGWMFVLLISSQLLLKNVRHNVVEIA
jgi:ABC-type polysaccharide/polyol phosphate export permease